MSSILATFKTWDQAEKAKQALSKAGYEELQISRVKEFPGEADADSDFNNPIASQSTSVSALTLYSKGYVDEDVAPLLATDPAASGLAGIPIDLEENILLTVVCDHEKLAPAVQILKDHGGTV